MRVQLHQKFGANLGEINLSSGWHKFRVAQSWSYRESTEVTSFARRGLFFHFVLCKDFRVRKEERKTVLYLF